MCYLYESDIELTEFVGYKVVVKNYAGDYFSPATGVRYPKSGSIPIPVIDNNRLCTFFNSKKLLLDKRENAGYEPLMVGRTGCFARHITAVSFLNELLYHTENKLVILEVRLTKELLIGVYYTSRVVAGKHMEILKECAN